MGSRVQFIEIPPCLFTARAVYVHRSSGENLWWTLLPASSPLERSMLTARAVNTQTAKTKFASSSFLSLLHFRHCLILSSSLLLWLWLLVVEFFLPFSILFFNSKLIAPLRKHDDEDACSIQLFSSLCFPHSHSRLLSSFNSSASPWFSTHETPWERDFESF